MEVPQKTKKRTTVWSSNPLLAIYPEKNISQRDTCSPVFTPALFTTAKTWKQPKCPLTEDWIKKTWYIHTMEYYPATKKEWNNAICSNMDGPRDYHSKWNTSDREGQTASDVIYTWNLKYNTTNLFTKTETDLQTVKTTLWLPKGKGGGGWRVWAWHMRATVHGKDGRGSCCVCSTGSSTRWSGKPPWERIRVGGANHVTIQQKLTQLCKATTLQYN